MATWILVMDDLREQVKVKWIEAGATPQAAEGIARRITKESGFDPKQVGDAGTSFGLYQEHNERADRLFHFASVQGKSPTDPLVQTDFAISEVKGGDPIAAAHAKEILGATTADAGYQAFTRYFERPASAVTGTRWRVNPLLAERLSLLLSEAPADIRADLMRALEASYLAHSRKLHLGHSTERIDWESVSPRAWNYIKDHATHYGLGFPDTFSLSTAEHATNPIAEAVLAAPTEAPQQVTQGTNGPIVTSPYIPPQLSIPRVAPLHLHAGYRLPQNLLTTSLGRILRRG